MVKYINDRLVFFRRKFLCYLFLIVIVLCRSVLNDICSDEEEVSGDVFDGYGENDEDVVW